jgi:hypothetical protein
MAIQIPSHIYAVVDAASLLASYHPEVRRHPFFPSTADKVFQMLAPAVAFIKEVTGQDVLEPNDTTKEMVSYVRYGLEKISHPPKPGEVQQHRGKI